MREPEDDDLAPSEGADRAPAAAHPTRRAVTFRRFATAVAILLGGHLISLAVTISMLSGSGGALIFVGPFLVGAVGMVVSFFVSLRVVTLGAPSGPVRIEPPLVAVGVVLLGWLLCFMLAIPRNEPLALASFVVPQVLGLSIYAWMRWVR